MKKMILVALTVLSSISFADQAALDICATIQDRIDENITVDSFLAGSRTIARLYEENRVRLNFDNILKSSFSMKRSYNSATVLAEYYVAAEDLPMKAQMSGSIVLGELVATVHKKVDFQGSIIKNYVECITHVKFDIASLVNLDSGLRFYFLSETTDITKKYWEFDSISTVFLPGHLFTYYDF